MRFQEKKFFVQKLRILDSHLWYSGRTLQGCESIQLVIKGLTPVNVSIWFETLPILVTRRWNPPRIAHLECFWAVVFCRQRIFCFAGWFWVTVSQIRYSNFERLNDVLNQVLFNRNTFTFLFSKKPYFLMSRE